MFENQYENLAHLSQQHEIDINQCRNIFEELNSAREEAQALWLDKRFQMKEQLTSEEWNKIFSSR